MVNWRQAARSREPACFLQ